MPELMRHVLAATAVQLPGRYHVLRLGADPVGYVLSDIAAALLAAGCARHDDDVVAPDAPALARAEQTLAEAGLLQLRGERFDVRAAPGGPVLAQVDRGTLPRFGIAAEGVHVNGLVRTASGLHLWIARRATTKLLDPGKLDHIVAGGICAGMDAAGTLVKEAQEEAAIPPELARTARFGGIISYAMERAEGLRRDRLYCYDLELPDDFHPTPHDGEVESFERLPLPDVLARVRETDDFKFNVNLVLIQLFGRLGLLARGSFGDAGLRIGV